MVVCIDPNPSKIKGDGFFWDLGTAATRGPLLRNSFLTVGSGERNDYLPGKQPTIAARGVCSAGGPTSVGSGPQDVSPALRSRAQNYGRRAVAAGASRSRSKKGLSLWEDKDEAKANTARARCPAQSGRDARTTSADSACTSTPCTRVSSPELAEGGVGM
jgi:hypothetical protein